MAGWYITGDFVIVDFGGLLRIVVSQSRFYKIAGEMVPHGKLEEVLQDLFPGVPAVVTGVPEDRRGERLVALLLPKVGMEDQFPPTQLS